MPDFSKLCFALLSLMVSGPVNGHSGGHHHAPPPQKNEPAPTFSSTSRNGSIRLFPASYHSSKRGSCSPTLPSHTLALPADVCLSGDYYLSTNVELNAAPTCADENPAYLAIFNRRGCTGSRTWLDHTRTSLPTCLDKSKWPLGASDTSSRSWSHWSLMFYCTHLQSAQAADGASVHWAAHPPEVHSAHREPQQGTFQLYACEADCHARKEIVKEEHFEAGSYFNFAAYIDGSKRWVRVSSPAVCADGKRAQLALYGDVGCDTEHYGGTHDHHAVLKDVTDEEAHVCVDVGSYSAVAFSCTGVGKLPEMKGHHHPGTGRSWWLYGGVVLLVVGAVWFVVVGLNGVIRIMVSQTSKNQLISD
jgi:hypothetical protein